MNDTKIVLSHKNTIVVDERIKDILARGKVVVFTNKLRTGIVKYVTKWNADSDGDLTAAYSTGANNYVCPYALEYEISETDVIPNN